MLGPRGGGWKGGDVGAEDGGGGRGGGGGERGGKGVEAGHHQMELSKCRNLQPGLLSIKE